LAALLAVGGTAAVAYKIGKNNAQKVEQYTGKSFDDLSEEELGTAMEELDIDLPEEDDDGGDLAEYPEEPDEPDYIDELERLAGLKEKGIISEEDFEAKKKQLLGL
jgi:FMN phosphatase YigB (HAD superfamily)